jgi:hypothetical protein
MAKNKKVNITITLKSNLVKGMRAVGRSLDWVKGKLFNFKTALLGMVGAGGALALFSKAIKTSFNFETMRTQLKVLLGSMQAAQKQFKLLRDFSAKTPFQLGGIVDAYQQLLTFTEGALATEKGLKLVGDAAAGRGKEFSEVAYWVGRLYASLKNGDPFMDSVGAMQRLGLAGGDIRGVLTRLTESGASFGEKWAVVEKNLLRFSGGMEQLSKTGDGLISTLKDNWTIALATFGDAFKESAKGGIETMINTIKKLVDDGTIEAWANKAKEAFDTIVATTRLLVSPPDKDTRKEVVGALAEVIKAAFLDGVHGAMELMASVAPKIGSAMGEAFVNAVNIFEKGKKKAQLRNEVYKDLEATGQLEERPGFFEAPTKMMERTERNEERINAEIARRQQAMISKEEKAHEAKIRQIIESTGRLRHSLQNLNEVIEAQSSNLETPKPKRTAEALVYPTIPQRQPTSKPRKAEKVEVEQADIDTSGASSTYIAGGEEVSKEEWNRLSMGNVGGSQRRVVEKEGQPKTGYGTQPRAVEFIPSGAEGDAVLERKLEGVGATEPRRIFGADEVPTDVKPNLEVPTFIPSGEEGLQMLKSLTDSALRPEPLKTAVNSLESVATSIEGAGKAVDAQEVSGGAQIGETGAPIVGKPIPQVDETVAPIAPAPNALPVDTSLTEPRTILGEGASPFTPGESVLPELGTSGGAEDVSMSEELKKINELLAEQNEILNNRLGGVKGD